MSPNGATKSTIQTRLVKPSPINNPNISANTTEIDIHPSLLWDVGNLGTVLTFPKHLDVDLLERSIASLASVLPVLCGRYRLEKRRFYIQLTESDIPFEVQTLPQSEAFNDYHVNQDSLQPYIPVLSPLAIKPNEDTPLFSVRYTALERRSVLGFMISHTLADAWTQAKIPEILSDIYTGAANRDYTFSSGLPELPELCGPLPDDMKSPIRENALLPEKIPPLVESRIPAKLAVVGTILSQDILESLRDTIQGFTSTRISRIDALSGWQVMLHELGSRDTINKLAIGINGRFVGAVPSNYFGSPIVGAVASVASWEITSERDKRLARAAEIAAAIRTQTNRVKNEPDYLFDWLRHAGVDFRRMRLEGRVPNFVFPPNWLLVNPYTRFDFAAGHFGFPGRVTGHISYQMYRSPRALIANVGNGDRGLEVDLTVRAEWRELVEGVIEEDKMLLLAARGV